MPLAERKGGAELLLLHLLNASRGEPDLEYSVAFLNDGSMVEEVRRCCPHVKVFRAGRLRDLHRWIITVADLAAWLRKQKADLVMSWMSTAHLYGAPAALLAGLPNVWWQHGFAPRSWLERVIAWLPCRETFCCSAAVARWQRSLSAKASCVVIHPGVDQTVFDPLLIPMQRQRVELGLPEEGLIVGMIGRLQQWKGMDVFVEAAAEIARERSDVHFLIVGGAHALEPAYPAALAQRIGERGLADRVTLAGFQPNPALWMNACNVIVHASVTPEPFGMVILEAMALGKVVIASAAGGPLEVVEHGVNGYLSPPGDAPELTNALRHALTVGIDDSELRNKARLTASRFSMERFASEVAGHLRRIVQSTTGEGARSPKCQPRASA